MKVLVVGGSRFVGKAIAARCVESGASVTLFNRGKTDPASGCKMIKGDVDRFVDFKEQIRDENFDVVVHCIAYTEQHALDLVEVLEGSETHAIVLSSCDCYEAFQGLNRNEDISEIPVNEGSELSKTRYYWRGLGTKGSLTEDYDKNLMTDVLQKANIEGKLNETVFRLPMVYGPGDHQYAGRHGSIIQRILDQKSDLIMSGREQCQVFTFGYVDNIADAIVHAFGRSDVFGKIYNLGEPVSRSRRRWADLYSELAGWNFNYHVLPDEVLFKNSEMRSAPPQHLIIDSSLYRRETGFKEKVDLQTAMQETFLYAKEHPECLGEKPDYASEKALLKKYYSIVEQTLSEVP